jgi:two-component system cell cycle sensor histidine kinase/response regulator CckA
MDSNRAIFASSEGANAILVVEDDPHVLRFLTRMLGSMGHDPVLQAAHPAEALRLWQTHRHQISLLISDFVMPGKTGDQLALQMRRDKPDLKVLLVSGNNPDSLHSAIPLIPGQSFLQKPFTVRDLKNTVEKLGEQLALA